MPLSSENVASSGPAAGRELRVLLVDDESVIRSAMTRYFARRGWSVCEAADGETARRMLDPLRGEEFDVVICDLRMPRTSGADLYQWLRQRRPHIAARFVFSTGDTLSPETAAFLAHAGRPVLPKPFELSELAQVVEQVRASVVSGTANRE